MTRNEHELSHSQTSIVRTLGIFFSVALISTALTYSPASQAQQSYYLFESGQVRPMAMAPDGQRLFVVNTPDNRLDIFGITAGGLTPVASVPVGMEPVAVAAVNNEVWVVNHLSDSVSVVARSGSGVWRVTRTLLVGDEPRDIVIAGPGRAFITAANRDLPRVAGDENRTAEVWVFRVSNKNLLTTINLFGDMPRPLAVSPDGNTVYAGIFNSGNQTALVDELDVSLGQGIPAPLDNIDGVDAPITSLIVKWDGTDWLDSAGRNWNNEMLIELPDYDVFTIDATTNPPVETGRISTVGTTLFNIATHPQTGVLYVANQESRNHIRFGGPGVYGGSSVNGYLTESRITLVDPSDSSITPRDLNKHLDRSDQTPGTAQENANSLAFPLDLTFNGDGSMLYVTAFGSSKIGVFPTAALDDDSFVPDEANHIDVAGGGPTGVVHDAANNRLYVLKRFSNTVGIVDLNSNSETTEYSLFDAEPQAIVDGRPFMYDARRGSTRGDSACASCHIFSDSDHLSWDLGNPDGTVVTNPNPFKIVVPGTNTDFHPMKGPMFTQTMRGLDNHGPMHWRGDQTGGNDPGGDPLDEVAALKKFNGAFGELQLGLELTEEELDKFVAFGMEIWYHPNPVRSIDNVLTLQQQRGRDFYMEFPSVFDQFACNHCHVLDPAAGFFGTDGLSARVDSPFVTNQGQAIKVPTLRDVYLKAMGIPEVEGPTTGPMIRGFNTGHDGGNEGKLINFFDNPPFTFPGGNPQRVDLAAFVMAYDTNLAPVVAQQITMTRANRVVARERVDIFVARCQLGECDLIVKGVVGGQTRGWQLQSNGRFRSDRASETPLLRSQLELLSQTAGQELTFTATPFGSGLRMGIDRDEDGFYDRDERDAGSDPADPDSIPVL